MDDDGINDGKTQYGNNGNGNDNGKGTGNGKGNNSGGGKGKGNGGGRPRASTTTTSTTRPGTPNPPTTTTTTVPSDFTPFEVTRKHGYWIGDPDVPTARWLMPLVNSGDSWAPDGNHVVYRSTLTSISVINVDTGATRVLISDPARSLSDPKWSPDGAHVAIHETQFDKPPVLLIVDTDGDEVARYPMWVDGQEGYAWSPDGSQIAFATYEHDKGEAGLYVTTVGGAPTRLATAGASHRFLGLRWSPQGTYLGWSYDEDLHLLRLSDKHEDVFDMDGSPVYGHAWSRDEQHVIVSGPGLRRMRTDGSEREVLDPVGHNPSVDPETGRIAWSSGYVLGTSKVIVSAPDGTGQRTTFTTAADAAIDGVMWSPTGGRLLFIQYG